MPRPPIELYVASDAGESGLFMLFVATSRRPDFYSSLGSSPAAVLAGVRALLGERCGRPCTYGHRETTEGPVSASESCGTRQATIEVLELAASSAKQIRKHIPDRIIALRL